MFETTRIRLMLHMADVYINGPLRHKGAKNIHKQLTRSQEQALDCLFKRWSPSPLHVWNLVDPHHTFDPEEIKVIEQVVTIIGADSFQADIDKVKQFL
ncbi:MULTISPECIES: hypothetical protein [Vibrio]|uniref:Uncharacterized protein n=1 Tax=Vibrio mediterranei TaxID=689 RepID=A0ABX5D962_9VIBR|nr:MULTISPECIES: hypothetical protein [Vibrio]EDL53442.1 transketolase [Vibrio mediterranei AK1]MCF4175761.1 hypothetical protein [Vibrio sp. McD22-P3]MCG9787294.1 hypothetical protein [Vibrio mediterranei]MDA0110085.1 hypothetical protein [Vibrio sp. La 4.2.2]NUW72789.1 hypothetical protein [Vibrio mediterranei]